MTFSVLPLTGFIFLNLFGFLECLDFNARNKSLTAKLLQQGYRYHKLRTTFSKFYRRHYELVSKFNVGLKPLLHQCLTEPEFYGDLVYKFKKIEGRADFSDQFRKINVRYKRIGYNINIMRQSACLVFNPVTVNNFASLFNCGGSGVRLNDGPDIKLFILVRWGRSFFVRCLAHRGSTVGFFCSSVSVVLFDTPGISRCRSQHVSVESSSLFHHSIYLWFICFPWWSIDELENLHADRTTVCFEPWQKPKARLGTRKTGLSPQVF